MAGAGDDDDDDEASEEGGGAAGPIGFVGDVLGKLLDCLLNNKTLERYFLKVRNNNF